MASEDSDIRALTSRIEDLEMRVSGYEDLETNLQLAGEAIGGLLWLITTMSNSNDLPIGESEEELDDVVDRVDQIAHRLR